MFSGVLTAIVTPFKNGKVDYDALEKNIAFQHANGVDAIVPCGTTGESPTLTYDEHEEIIEFSVARAKGKMQVLAGTGSNSTDEALRFTAHAKKVGADGALIVTPYYNKPTQKGLYLHFKKIADSVDIPIMIYNIASRTGVNVETSTLTKLAHDCKNIVSVKEASGNLEQMGQVICANPEMSVISGDDTLTLPLMAVGGLGVVSVLSNIIPQDVVSMVKAFKVGDTKKAKELHLKMLPLAKAMFIETNPQPIKTAMSLLGHCEAEVRLPMCEMEEANKAKLVEALKNYGLKV
ncbi:MAG: 4-hydroxy-tetrahydrodipicolinate synthase [Elusimicrobia bacterium]|nr:4-hydroxy-tetrahydrodipicolinate synthase [Elusimicrobiota bacterium]